MRPTHMSPTHPRYTLASPALDKYTYPYRITFVPCHKAVCTLAMLLERPARAPPTHLGYNITARPQSRVSRRCDVRLPHNCEKGCGWTSPNHDWTRRLGPRGSEDAPLCTLGYSLYVGAMGMGWAAIERRAVNTRKRMGYAGELCQVVDFGR